MLRSAGGDIPRLARILRQRLRLSQSGLGDILGVHRNAIVRVEAGKYGDGARWLRDLFLSFLVLNDRGLCGDVRAIREYAKSKTPMEPGAENSALFEDFLRKLAESGNDPALLSGIIRKEHGLTQEELSRLLCVDRTAVTQLEARRHKYPERLLADLYLARVLIDDPGLKAYVLSLRGERPGKAASRPVLRTQGPGGVQAGEGPEAGYAAEPAVEAARAAETGPEMAYAAGGAQGQAATAQQTPAPDESEETANLRRYGFRTRQELYNAMRQREITLEERRRIALIEASWDDDIKREEARRRVRAQMEAVRGNILRELFDRTADSQTAFLRASNSFKKGLSMAEVANENNGCFSLPFCMLWERHGFSLVKFLAWKPSETEIFEIYRDYEPEFRINTLEYKFRPRKGRPPEKEPAETSLDSLLKRWFPQIADEIGGPAKGG